MNPLARVDSDRNVHSQSHTTSKLVKGGIDFLRAFASHEHLEASTRDEAQGAANQIEALLSEQRLKLAVLGETSAGKSTFINALLQIELLAADLEPTTAVPTRLRWGPAFQVTIAGSTKATQNLSLVRASGEREAVERVWSGRAMLEPDGQLRSSARPMVADFIRRYTTEGAGYAATTNEVLVQLPSTFLAPAIDLIDTPGTNPGISDEARRRHKAVTMRCVEESHLGIFVIDSRNPLKATEQRDLAEIAPYLSRFFFVANKMDLHDDEEAADTEDYIRTELASKFGIAPAAVTLYFVSSVPRRGGRTDRFHRELMRLRSDIVEYMQRSRAGIILERTARHLSASARSVESRAQGHASAASARLNELKKLQIAKPDEMVRQVTSYGQSAYEQAVVTAWPHFLDRVATSANSAVHAFASQIGTVTEKKMVGPMCQEILQPIYQRHFIAPAQENLTAHLVWAIHTGLAAMHSQCVSMYAGIELKPPMPPNEKKVRRLLEVNNIVNSDGSLIAANVEGLAPLRLVSLCSAL